MVGLNNRVKEVSDFLKFMKEDFGVIAEYSTGSEKTDWRSDNILTFHDGISGTANREELTKLVFNLVKTVNNYKNGNADLASVTLGENTITFDTAITSTRMPSKDEFSEALDKFKHEQEATPSAKITKKLGESNQSLTIGAQGKA